MNIKEFYQNLLRKKKPANQGTNFITKNITSPQTGLLAQMKALPAFLKMQSNPGINNTVANKFWQSKAGDNLTGWQQFPKKEILPELAKIQQGKRINISEFKSPPKFPMEYAMNALFPSVEKRLENKYGPRPKSIDNIATSAANIGMWLTPVGPGLKVLEEGLNIGKDVGYIGASLSKKNTPTRQNMSSWSTRLVPDIAEKQWGDVVADVGGIGETLLSGVMASKGSSFKQTGYKPMKERIINVLREYTPRGAAWGASAGAKAQSGDEVNWKQIYTNAGSGALFSTIMGLGFETLTHFMLRKSMSGEYSTARNQLADKLGIDRNAPIEEFKRAYIDFAKRYHPDVISDKSNKTFQEVSSLWDIVGKMDKYNLRYNPNATKYEPTKPLLIGDGTQQNIIPSATSQIQLDNIANNNISGRTFNINKMTPEVKKQFLNNQSIIKNLHSNYANEKLPEGLKRVYWEIGKNADTDWRFGNLVDLENWLGTTKHNKADIHTKVVPETSLQPMSNGTFKEIPTSNLQEPEKQTSLQSTQTIKIKEPDTFVFKRSKVNEKLTKIKRVLENSEAPVEDVLNDYELMTNSKIRPQSDLRIQFAKVNASNSLATQYAKDNGLEDIIQDAKTIGSLDEAGEYLIAKHAPENEAQGKATGRDLAKDAAFVEANKTKYEGWSQKVVAYNRKLLDYMVDEGLISRAGRDYMVKTYPNYVPMNRILDNEDVINALNSRMIGSVAQQRLVRKLIGSEREIKNPLANMLDNTYRAINDIERNKAARIMSQYKDLEGNPFNIREIGNKESIGKKHVFSFLDNGIKRTFEVSKEVEEVLKGLGSEDMGIVLKIATIPTRVLQAGATGLNLPFVISNYIKDQQFNFITSNKTAQESFLNPVNVVKGIYYAVGKGDLYEQVVREAGITTQFEISRGDVKKTLGSIAANRNLKSKIAYTATHPLELIEVIENIIGTTEQATRVQVFKGTYDSYIKQGASEETARLYAGQAARENTANFRKTGTLGKIVNKFFSFFNAGIQGAKALRTAFLKHPKGTALKILIAVGIPTAYTTIRNLMDAKKKAVYDDIQEWEKENNLIIIPDNIEKDEQGRWKVIKIPTSPGTQGFSNIIRKFIEEGNRIDPAFATYVAKNLFEVTTSLNVDNPQMPQLIKPSYEYLSNQNSFTGKQIVPSNMKYLDKEDQVYPWTSGTARAVGKVFNMSPIMVENLVSTVAGGSGKQALNASDTILNKMGLIPDEQVGGESAMDNLVKRFTLASGGAEADRIEKEAKQGMTQLEAATYDFLKSYKSKADKSKMTDGEKEWFKIGQNALQLSNPKVSEALRAEAMVKAMYNDEPQNPFNMLSEGQRKIVLTINSLPKGEDKSALQKQNIDWLKPYWEANTNYFAYKAVKAYEESGTIMEESKQPIASEYVQKQMDLKNWKDPQVQAYLKANNEYKNYIRLSMGLPALDGYGSGGSGYDPMKYFHPKIKVLKMKKLRLKKLPKIKKAKRKTYKKIATKKITIKPIKVIKIKKPKSIGKIKVRS